LKGEREVKNNVEIALPSRRWEFPLNDIWKEVFEFVNLEMKELHHIRHTSRFLKVYPSNWKAQIFDNNVVDLEFHLPPGSYATVVLRELMQRAPMAYF
jgi:tRNA(Glu) U13 pseudouridine synthase TruD